MTSSHMSKALVSFEGSIKDAEDLLAHFDAMPKPPPPNAEVLKRAGLVMALTAWETYVEDRVREEVTRRLRVVNGSYVGKFVASRLEEELKRFHNPTSDKTKKLFHDFLEVDVVSGWEWTNFDSAKARRRWTNSFRSAAMLFTGPNRLQRVHQLRPI
ncbi:HEPN domain-containing protein [Paucibacter sp. O1-1]|nr:HEPN domain-containing protein [Paucibacter sp. O1-1]MDA3829885.1 HEPN domain-containing protein [Paucibacter sp. O1-1]